MRQGRQLALAGLGVFAILLAGCGGSGPPIAYYLPACPPAASAESEGPAQARPALAWPLPEMNLPIGPEEDAPATGPTEPSEPVHWSKRRGPAYEGDWLHSFGRDAKELPATMWGDTKATFTDPWAWVGLGLAGASGIVLNASGSDNRVADHYDKHGSQLNGFWDTVGDVGGNPGTHFAFAGVMYFGSLVGENTKAYETSKALLNGLAINGLTTLALKGITRTRSPNGDPFGWPSGHTSSTFCLATVMHEAYGPWVGVPLFAFASYVGYERIDARNHDFSDVISGALIGVAIGHAVFQNHKPKVFGFEVVPWADPARGTLGIALTKRF